MVCKKTLAIPWMLLVRAWGEVSGQQKSDWSKPTSTRPHQTYKVRVYHSAGFMPAIFYLKRFADVDVVFPCHQTTRDMVNKIGTRINCAKKSRIISAICPKISLRGRKKTKIKQRWCAYQRTRTAY